MTKEKAQRMFKKHYRYAMKLKEGGKAWEREMARADHYQNIVLNNICSVKTISDTVACANCGLEPVCKRKKEVLEQGD